LRVAQASGYQTNLKSGEGAGMLIGVLVVLPDRIGRWSRQGCLPE